MFLFFLQYLVLIVFFLISIAFLTLVERKTMSSMQRRRGPDVFGFWGLLQPIADGIKLFLKETIFPTNANILIFILAPILTFILSLLNWVVIPFSTNFVLVDLDLGLFFILTLSALNVYGVLLAGWSSNSKYAFLGSLRSTAQMISYEVSLGFILISLIFFTQTFNLSEFVLVQSKCWLCFPMLPLVFVFYISILAETNRHPFDLPEAEAELVSGYNVEYSAMGFALFFLGEYGNIILMSLFQVLLFFGGWFPYKFFFVFKILVLVLLFIWVRAAYPRYRYDQLMRLGWKIFLPFSLGWASFSSSWAYSLFWSGIDLKFSTKKWRRLTMDS